MVYSLISFRRKRKWVAGLGAVLASGIFWLPTAAADSAISQSYSTNSTNISQGTLISLAASNSSFVVPASTSSNIDNLIGVAASKPLIELSEGGKSGVQVVVSGTTSAMVSDINGTVKVGDRIAPSPIEGIGMKATHSSEIVGTAQANLSNVPTLQKTVDGTDGKTVTITVGLVPIGVSVAYYSAVGSQGNSSSYVPSFLQAAANAVTGRQVSPLRVLFGAMALLLGFVSVTVMLYASIRNGVISLGRNPLAEIALRRGLIDVIIAGAGVLVMTILLVFVILLG